MENIEKKNELGRGIHPQHTGGVRRKYLLKKDKVDPNNILYKTHFFELSKAPLPKIVDLRAMCPPIYDQGDLGSCTANAIGANYQFDQMKQKSKNIITPSRLFIYYNERKMEGTISQDSGASISDGIMSVHNDGVCSETDWPYNVTNFAMAPPQTLYTQAQNHKAGQYKRLSQNLVQLKTGLASGIPIVFGMQVFESFESDQVAKTGIVPMPQKNDQSIGGHCVEIVGYRDSDSKFIVRNSWGTNWGDKGYFYLPYSYVTNQNLSFDFWSIINVIDK